MSKFSIVFVSPDEAIQLKHRIVESDDQESALKQFFQEETTGFYTADEQGYFYFKEDFFDPTRPSGSILQCD